LSQFKSFLNIISDPDSCGSADPDPDWKLGSKFRQVKIVPQKREKLRSFMFEESEHPLYGFEKTYMAVFDQKDFPIINFLKILS